MKRYKAKRNGLIHYTLGGLLLLTAGLLYSSVDALSQQPLILLPLLSPVGLMLWLYFDTVYIIDGSQLLFRCTCLRGSIDIHRIQSIRVGETMWAGLKPALATGGLIVRYNKFDEIYLAPANNDELVTDLLAINPTIDSVRQSAIYQRTSQINQP